MDFGKKGENLAQKGGDVFGFVISRDTDEWFGCFGFFGGGFGFAR